MTDYVWHCPSCGQYNKIEPHTDPAAHYPSLVCDSCGEEIEQCYEGMARNAAAVSLGKAGGTARARRLTAEERSISAAKAARARWGDNTTR